MFVISNKKYFIVLCELTKKSKETIYSLFKLDISGKLYYSIYKHNKLKTMLKTRGRSHKERT